MVNEKEYIHVLRSDTVHLYHPIPQQCKSSKSATLTDVNISGVTIPTQITHFPYYINKMAIKI